MMRRCLIAICLSCVLGLTAACDTAEERAEKHYQTALEHLENGDIDRAIVEFRNVFKLNGRHKEARLTFARMLRDRGSTSEAYAQYLRLTEQYPDILESRQALAEMAVEAGDWDEAERHGRAAAELAPEDPLAQSVLTALDYRAAVMEQDTAAQAAAFDKAKTLLVAHPDLISAHRVIIETLIQDQNWPAALEALDAALQASPDLLVLYTMRLIVLEHLGDTAAIKEQLQDMAEQFPDDPVIEAHLLNWFVSNGEHDAAEDYLRARITPDADSPDARIRLVRFLQEYRGPDAALAELDRIMQTPSPHETTYRVLHAVITHDSGRTDRAIAELEELLAGATPSAEINNAKVTLARMLIASGEVSRAQALVEEVLASDPAHVDAIKLKAVWLIEADRPGDAITLLRAAQRESPRDAELMTLLAQAHEREGNRDLMADMLFRAVQASGSAPAETLRYAAFLVENDTHPNAESVLLDALELHPENIQLLTALGMLYVDLQDWPRAEKIMDRLDDFGEQTADITGELTARMLAGQGNEQALISYLETLSRNEGAGLRARINLIRSHVVRGDLKTALTQVDQALKNMPDDVALRLVRSAVLAMDNRPVEAESELRALLQERPETEQAWLTLYRLKAVRGEMDAAERILDEALSTVPQSLELQWVKAGALEQAGDTEGAIAIYEAMYAQNSNLTIVANNLASLLSTYREDDESLERAYAIARRLRDSDIPAFQDTYGWIAYRRGDFEDALTHLHAAAEKLPAEPLVQYHLARTYAALNRDSEALEAFRKVIALDAPAPLLKIARSEVMRLAAETETMSDIKADN